MDESLITPALRARIGVPSEPVMLEVTPLLVERVREMLGEVSAAGDDRVPPAVLNMPDAGREVAPLPGLPEHSLLTGDEWELRRPIRLGETLAAVNRLADVSERLSGRLGHALMLRHEWIFTDAAGETVAFARRSIAHYAQESVRPREEPPPGDGPPPEGMVAGADPRTAREGDPIASTVVTPTLEQVIRYIAIAWNFVPIFYDAKAARAAGLPGTLIPGPLKLSLLAESVLGWAGNGAWLESIRATFRRPDTPGRALLLGGAVIQAENLGAGRRLTCEVWMQNADGERSAAGVGVVHLPVV